jgi:hypothetical protein
MRCRMLYAPIAKGRCRLGYKARSWVSAGMPTASSKWLIGLSGRLNGLGLGLHSATVVATPHAYVGLAGSSRDPPV